MTVLRKQACHELKEDLPCPSSVISEFVSIFKHWVDKLVHKSMENVNVLSEAEDSVKQNKSAAQEPPVLLNFGLIEPLITDSLIKSLCSTIVGLVLVVLFT